MGNNNWEDAYFLYRDFESRWPKSQPHAALKQGLYRLDQEQINVFTQHLKLAGELPPEKLIEQGYLIAKYFKEAGSDIDILDDVYHAAILMLRDSSLWVKDRENSVYRGQRYPWPVRPSLFRDNPFEAELRRKLDTVGQFSSALESKYPGRFSEYQRLAIAQHYGLPTWLVDLTEDPFIALFFASSDACEGDVGIVAQYSPRAWQELSARGKNRLGTIRLIGVPGVPRLEAQKGLFLEGAHPDLIEQYVAYLLRFRQREGVTFRDPTIGITDDRLLPKVDEFLTFTEAWKPVAGSTRNELSISPPTDADRRLEAADYLAIAKSWLKEDSPGFSPSPGALLVLERVCHFHADLQSVRDKVSPPARSLRRLNNALRTIVRNDSQGADSTFEKAIYQYRSHASPEDIALMDSLVDESSIAILTCV